MKRSWTFLIAVFGLVANTVAQNDVPAMKAEVKSAFVWGEDSNAGAVSSTIQDPLTGNAIRKLSYAGTEVSSRVGFERVGADKTGTLLNYSTTIVNGTESQLSIRFGGITVDGHAVSPLEVVFPGRKFKKKERQSEQDVAALTKMHCFTSGFLSTDNLFSADTASRVLTVAPGSALTVSSVVKDPRAYHSIRCSIEGCYPTGTTRYYITINSQDYVFVWPGRSAIYCGK